MSFSNETMRQPIKGKPHIAFIKGYWRVSKTPKPYHKYSELWNDAHMFARIRNVKIFHKKFKRS